MPSRKKTPMSPAMTFGKVREFRMAGTPATLAGRPGEARTTQTAEENPSD